MGMSTDAILLPDDPAQLKALLLREREQREQLVADCPVPFGSERLGPA
jgi:hypothetical protein